MPFVSLDQLTTARVQWLWPGRLPIGYLTIFDGDPGIGKSLLTLDLAARITTGRPFPEGTAASAPASVIILNAEDGGSGVISGRLQAAGADLSRVQIFDREVGEAFLRLPGHLPRLEEAIVRKQVRYVVIDPILGYLDERVQPACDPSVRAALAPLAELAARHGCAIQMIRHLNKGVGTKALYRGLYSIGFIASCRLAWLAGRDPKLSNRYVLTQPKNNFDTPASSLAYAIEADSSGQARIVWQGDCPVNENDLLAGTPERRQLRMRVQDFLLDFLKDGPRSTREIWPAAQELGLAHTTVNRAKQELRIVATYFHRGLPDQTSFWVLPSQAITTEVSDNPYAANFVRDMTNRRHPQTPLD
ncbi:MAG: AAA family ATPase [Planctomycetes bacterium]|nr:AAA family ATPase [Planctomycetota bacterium]